MKIALFSDFHFEFGASWRPPRKFDADVVVLAGDCCVPGRGGEDTLKDFLDVLAGRQVILVAGNHESYGSLPPSEVRSVLRALCTQPDRHYLDNEGIILGGVSFFGGTMWTDFNKGDPAAMSAALQGMNDYVHCVDENGDLWTPETTRLMHGEFVEKLRDWARKPCNGPRVVVTHHAPIANPQGELDCGDWLAPAFITGDGEALVREIKPDLWCFGHTHETWTTQMGPTKLVANQAGYPVYGRYNEAAFDPLGMVVTL